MPCSCPDGLRTCKRGAAFLLFQGEFPFLSLYVAGAGYARSLYADRSGGTYPISQSLCKCILKSQICVGSKPPSQRFPPFCFTLSLSLNLFPLVCFLFISLSAYVPVNLSLPFCVPLSLPLSLASRSLSLSLSLSRSLSLSLSLRRNQVCQLCAQSWSQL